jgi:hypothetical protein
MSCYRWQQIRSFLNLVAAMNEKWILGSLSLTEAFNIPFFVGNTALSTSKLVVLDFDIVI